MFSFKQQGADLSSLASLDSFKKPLHDCGRLKPVVSGGCLLSKHLPLYLKCFTHIPDCETFRTDEVHLLGENTLLYSVIACLMTFTSYEILKCIFKWFCMRRDSVTWIRTVLNVECAIIVPLPSTKNSDLAEFISFHLNETPHYTLKPCIMSSDMLKASTQNIGGSWRIPRKTSSK